MANIDLSSPGTDEAALRQALQATLGNWRVLGASAVAVPHTGTLTETALATIVVPAGAMGPNGILRVTTISTVNTNANNKTLRIRFGGSSAATGTQFMSVANTTGISHMNQRLIHNRNSQSVQIGAASGVTNGFAASTAAAIAGAIDTSVAVNLMITGILADVADTITLESHLVELFYKA